MANNLMNINTAPAANFKNSELNAVTITIAKQAIDMANNLRAIAEGLGIVATKELYKDDGFTSAADYAMETFNFGKTFAYDLINIGKRFTTNKELNEFSASHLKELLPLKDEQVKDAIANGDITADMTTSEVRTKVAELKNKDKKSVARKAPKFIFYLWNTGDIIATATLDDFITAYGSSKDNYLGCGATTLPNGQRVITLYFSDSTFTVEQCKGIKADATVKDATEK